MKNMLKTHKNDKRIGFRINSFFYLIKKKLIKFFDWYWNSLNKANEFKNKM